MLSLKVIQIQRYYHIFLDKTTTFPVLYAKVFAEETEKIKKSR